MKRISEEQKHEYLKNLESNTAILTKDIAYQLLNDKDSYFRCRLAEALVNHHTELSKELLTKLLYDTDYLVRANACDSLYWSTDKTVVDKLLSLLKNDMYLVRGYALSSITDIIVENNYVEFIPQIKSIMKCEKSRFVRLYYYSFLYKIGEHDAIYNIINSLNAKRYDERCNAANILYYIVDNPDCMTVVEAMKKRLEIETIYSVKVTLERCVKELENN